MIVSASEMQRIEETAFARGVNADDLMAEAGRGIAQAVSQFFPQAGTLVLCLGKGNNAGDALVAARHLRRKGWRIVVRLAYPVEALKPLPLHHWSKLKQESENEACSLLQLQSLHELARQRGGIVMLDGLVGIGVKGELKAELAAIVAEMNELRRSRHATSVALDLPSGLDDQGFPTVSCVEADITMTIAHGKSPLLSDKAVNHVGRLVLIPLAEMSAHETMPHFAEAYAKKILHAAELLPYLRRRQFDFHKGMAGRVGVIAGEVGTIGAAVMCASSVLHAGAGLITLYAASEQSYTLLAQACPPEVMVKPVKDFREALDSTQDVLAIGPGLGSKHKAEVLDILRQATCPMVLDADGLNMLAEEGLDTLHQVNAPLLLTPHPGEMKRLLAGKPQWQGLSRAQQTQAFCEAFKGCTLLLKGARTVIGAKGQLLAFNTTGNPGMASGGMGDVLTGITAALIGQGMSLYDAACLGAWLSGRAAELACQPAKSTAVSQESLTATMIIDHLGAAFESLKALDY